MYSSCIVFSKIATLKHRQRLKRERRKGIFKGEGMQCHIHLERFWYFFRKKYKANSLKYVRRVQTPPSLQSKAFGESRPFRYFISDSFDTLMLKNFARSKSLKLICSVSLKPPCSAEEKNYRRFYEIFFTFSCKLSNDLKYRSLFFAIATRYVAKKATAR